ncbi:NAD-dependent succinate-semialdehyde dehydrogenase [Glutamicibacter sp. NPDC127525]|uniref:NAD-dependent succinate-semialdehyde dehydrogenase n=1 Tax=unclassified Glutamicibacter TaxID=2627139 RepID=UPI0036359281
MTTITTVNPATGDQLGRFERIDDSELERRMATADRAQKQWRKRPLERRSALLHAVADLYKERAAELAHDIALEMGKPYKAALAEIALVNSIFEYYADHAGKMMETRDLEVFGGGTARLRKDPIGVLLGIMPWNFPHYQVARFVAPNLMLGNTTIIKHASISAQSAQNIADIFSAAGADEGIYTNIFADHAQIESMVADTRIKGVSLTGSDAAGERIGALAGKHIKPCVLELGGADPFIVLADADVDRAAKAAVEGRCNNAGQQCTGAKRFIIEAPVYDEFVELFVKGMEGVVVGDPFDEATEMGSLSSSAALQELETQVALAVADGADVLTGGQRLEGPGAYFPPTVLANVAPGNRAYYQEMFGPVAMVFKVGSVAEAIDLANDSPYGLSSAIFSGDKEMAEQISEDLETGMVYINSVSKSSPELPFGGVKRSGVGRELGPLGIDEFANLKLVRRP